MQKPRLWSISESLYTSYFSMNQHRVSLIAPEWFLPRPNFALKISWSFYHEYKQSDYPWSEGSHPQLHLHPVPMPTQRQARYFQGQQKTHPGERQSVGYLKLDDLQIK